MSDNDSVGSGATFLFIATTISMFSGYAFWYIVSLITTPTVIGTASAVVSLATIFVAIVTVGIPTGVQRFIGKSFSVKDLDQAGIYVKISVLIVSISISVLAIGLVIGNQWLGPILDLDFTLLLIAIAYTAATALMTLLRSIIIASLKTRNLPIIMLAAVIFKISLAVLLVFNGSGVLGILIGLTSFPVLSSVLLSVSLLKTLRPAFSRENHDTGTISRNVLKSSFANWIPGLVATVGVQLGTLAVFGGEGAHAAGVYFIALSVATVVATIASILFSIGYPMLSAMTDGRKKYTEQLIRLSMVIGMPLASFVIFYADDIMGVFGAGYVEGQYQLIILVGFMAPLTVMGGITTLLYAYGNYKDVFAVGICTAVPRTILYFILVNVSGGLGAAAGFSIGTLSGFILSMAFAHKLGFAISWRKLGSITLIPLGISYSLSFFDIHFLVAIVIVLVFSFLLFVRLRLLTGDEARSALRPFPAFVSLKITNLIEIVSGVKNTDKR